ncbi:MAG: DUF4350 domain-containing protein [Armatimonadia bacterium]
MAKHRGLMIFLALIAVFTAVALLMPRSEYDPVRDHSVTRTNEWGTKALADLARENGLQVVPWQQRLSALQGQRLLLLLNPTYEVKDTDLQAALKWVAQGGTLVVAPDLDDPGDVKPDEDLLTGLGLVSVYVPTRDATVTPVATEPILREVTKVQVTAGARLKAVPQGAVRRWRTLMGDSRGAAVMAASHGKGTIYALCDANILANGYLTKADNVILASNLLWQYGQQGVYFDEFVHNPMALQEEDERLDPSTAIWAAVLAGAALLVFLLSRGSRFGAAVPLVTPPRRSALEFVGALAELYRRAEARGAVVEILHHSFRRRLGQIAGVSPELPPAALATALGRVRPELQQQVEGLLEQLHDAAQRQPDERELLHLTRQVAHYEEALTHGH